MALLDHNGLGMISQNGLQNDLDMRMRIGIVRIEKGLRPDIGGMGRASLRDEDMGEMEREDITARRRGRRMIGRVEDIIARKTRKIERVADAIIVMIPPLEVYPL